MPKNRHLYLFSIIFLILLSTAASCPPNCLFCLLPDKCITCQTSFALSTSSLCTQKTIQNCRVYSENGQCAICESTFQVNNNQCFKDFSGCLARDKSGICQQCGFGTTLNIKGECLGVINCAQPQRNCKQCKIGYRLVNNKCIYAANDCQVIQSNGLCSQCKNGFILSGFECVNRGTSSIANGNINLVEKCSLYSRNQNNCLQCEEGYTFLNYKCVSNGEYYKVTLNNADNKIRQRSNVTYINTPSEFIKFDGVIYSTKNRKDDFIDDETMKVQQKIIFQGVGSNPAGNSNLGTNTGNQNGGGSNGGNSNNGGTNLNGGNNGGSTNSGTNGGSTNGGSTNGGNNGGNTNGGNNPININEGCLIKARDTLGCSVCIDGYYFFNGLCKRKTPVCTKFNTTINKCEACHETFALVNGDCEDLNCQRYLYAQCQKCKQGFLLNEQGYCFDPYCSAKNQGFCVKCMTGYELDQTTKLCYKIITGCSVYKTGKTQCNQCQINFSFGNGVCSRQQDERCLIYNSKNSQECTRCSDKFAIIQGTCIDLYCRSFENAKTCTRCRQGYTLHPMGYCFDLNCVLYNNGTCINCANNYQLQQGFCVNVLIGCTRVDPLNQACANCISGYRLVNGKCIFLDNQRCLRSSGDFCTSCKPEYALVSNTCVDLLCERQTLQNNFFVCQLCKAGFNLTKEGLCYDENCYQSVNGSCAYCTDTYIIGPNGLCVKSTVGCMSWNYGENRCSSCHSGYTLASNGVCVIPTPSTNGGNTNSNTSGNLNGGNSGTNSNTNNNNNPNTNTNPNSNNNPNTNNDNNGNTNTNTNTNPNTNPNANTNGNTNTNTNSTNPTRPTTPSVVDNPGTLTDKDIQIPNKTKPNDPNCKEYDSNSDCTRCQGRFFIRNSKCQPVPSICRGFDMKSGNCTSCQSGFLLYTEQSPFQDCYKRLQSDPNCNRKNINFFCVRCRPGYYIKAGYCYLADTLCKTFDMYGGECITCYEGYLLQGDKCIPLTQQSKCKTFDFQNVCVDCENRYFVDKAGVCRQINSACLTYQMAGGNCLTCQLGYWPSNGLCFKVKDPVPNCKLTNELGNCVQCDNRYYLDGSTITCKGVNPLCNDYNINSGACLNCSNGYKLRADLGLCVMENSQDMCEGFSDNGYCAKCPVSFVLTKEYKCVRVSPLCSIYSPETGECERCVDTHYLSFRECVIKFRKDFLDPNCITGDNNNFCLRCRTGYFTNTGNCLKASDQCRTFNPNTGACDTCYQGFVIKNRECVSSNTNVNEDYCELRSGTICTKCKDRYYLEYGAGLPTCARVNSLCKTYNELNGNCYTCVDGYALSAGNCVQGVNNNGGSVNGGSVNGGSTSGSTNGNTNQGTNGNTNANSNTNSNTNANSNNNGNTNTNPTTNPNTNPNTNTNTNTNTNPNNNNNPNTNTNTNTTPTNQYIEVAQIFCLQYDLPAQICRTCYSGYYYSSQELICRQINTDCRTYNLKNGWCTSCFQGYYLVDNACLLNSSSGSSSGSGSSSESGSSSGSGTWSIKLPEQRIDSQNYQLYCQRYNPTTNRCTTCITGYQLSSNGACSLATTVNPDPYCTSFTQSKCVNCLFGYYIDTKTGLCTLQNLWCETYQMIGGTCAKCKVGSIMQNGVCIKPALGVDPYCSYYDGAYCFNCVDGYKLVNFACQKNK